MTLVTTWICLLFIAAAVSEMLTLCASSGDEKMKKDPTLPDIKSLNLTAIGCFKDNGGKVRPFPFVAHQMNFFVYNDWNDILGQIDVCRKLVKSKSYKYFGYQHFGECWYGPPLLVNYAKDGNSTNCTNGAGTQSSLMVYRLND